MSQPSASKTPPVDPNERLPVLRAIGRALVSVLPRNEILFRVARKIVERHNAEGDFDMRTNGELWLARTALPGARVVFDVGANRGEWAAVAHSIVPEARIHCFEPSLKTFALLQKELSVPNVVLNDFGLSDDEEERTLWVYDEGSGANSLYHRVGTIGTQTGTESVRMRTLDGYCAEHGIEAVDFLKIDVEGHEVSVFRGAERMLRQSGIGVVQFEYNDTYIDARTQLKDIWQFVRDVAPEYSFYKIFPRELKHIPEYSQRYETFRYSNWAVLRRDVARRMGLLA